MHILYHCLTVKTAHRWRLTWEVQKISYPLKSNSGDRKDIKKKVADGRKQQEFIPLSINIFRNIELRYKWL